MKKLTIISLILILSISLVSIGFILTKDNVTGALSFSDIFAKLLRRETVEEDLSAADSDVSDLSPAESGVSDISPLESGASSIPSAELDASNIPVGELGVSGTLPILAPCQSNEECTSGLCEYTPNLHRLACVCGTREDCPEGEYCDRDSSKLCKNEAAYGSHRIYEGDEFISSTNPKIILKIESIRLAGAWAEDFFIDPSDPIVILIYSIENEKGRFPIVSYFLTPKHGFSWLGIFNIQQEEGTYSEDDNSIVINLFKSCLPIYNKCLESGIQGNLAALYPCTFFCPDEEMPGDIFVRYGKVFAKSTQESDVELVKIRLNCSTRDLNYQIGDWQEFGIDYPFPFVKSMYFPDYGSTGTFGIGSGILRFGNAGLTTERRITQTCLDSVASGEYDPIQKGNHEINHNFVYGTTILSLFNEGLANFMSVYLRGEEQLICSETGYKFVGAENEPEYPYQQLSSDSQIGDIFSGQCFWETLEDNYGEAALRRVLINLDNSRYINPSTGVRESKRFIRDIVNPAIGADLTQMVLDRYNYHDSPI